MQQSEKDIQALTDSNNWNIDYSDGDIVIADSIREFTEVKTARGTMNAIVFCLAGKAQWMMSDRAVLLQQNQVAIIPANVTVNDVMISPDCELKALFLTSSIIQSFLREKINVWNKVLYIHGVHIFGPVGEEDILFFRRFSDMLQTCIDKPAEAPFRTDAIQSLLRGALLYFCGTLQEAAPTAANVQHEASTSSGHFRRFLDLLHTSDHQQHSVAYYADRLCLTPKYLSTICKQHSGKTANEWIREQLLEDIRYYLRQTDLSIKQVSDRLGFANPSFFGKYVKEHFDMTPMQYRQKQA